MTRPQELVQTSPQKQLAEDSLSYYEAGDDYTLKAINSGPLSLRR
jgi:hypothetical protein